MGGNKYFTTLVKNSTKYYYMYFLKRKDEVLEKFVLYKTEDENQVNKKIKVFSPTSPQKCGKAILLVSYILNKGPRKEK